MPRCRRCWRRWARRPARKVPDRAGADTQVITHIPISQLRQMPGGSAIEDAWINARLGEPGYLAGKDAEAAACDALTIPVVTGHPILHQPENLQVSGMPGAWLQALRYQRRGHARPSGVPSPMPAPMLMHGAGRVRCTPEVGNQRHAAQIP